MEVVDIIREVELQQQEQHQEEEEEQHFHVLAVDDSVIDRKLLERLLRSSSYKGIYIYSYVPKILYTISYCVVNFD